jgi:hypothetical protein
MNQVVWLMMLPFLFPFMVIGFLVSWAVVGFGIGFVYAKELAEWVAE